jgi:hypothetical protein
LVDSAAVVSVAAVPGEIIEQDYLTKPDLVLPRFSLLSALVLSR